MTSTRYPGVGLLTALVLMFAGCGESTDPDPNCGLVGTTRACVCSGGGNNGQVSGGQICVANGSWGPCECNGPVSDTSEADTQTGVDTLLTDTSTCTPDCQDRTCGDDGCGSTCGDCTGGGSCTNAGVCE